jgi:hypothetical protein
VSAAATPGTVGLPLPLRQRLGARPGVLPERPDRRVPRLGHQHRCRRPVLRVIRQRGVPQLVQRRGLAEQRGRPLAEQRLCPLIGQPRPALLIPGPRPVSAAVPGHYPVLSRAALPWVSRRHGARASPRAARKEPMRSRRPARQRRSLPAIGCPTARPPSASTYANAKWTRCRTRQSLARTLGSRPKRSRATGPEGIRLGGGKVPLLDDSRLDAVRPCY